MEKLQKAWCSKNQNGFNKINIVQNLSRNYDSEF